MSPKTGELYSNVEHILVNTKQFGNIGVAIAINYFASNEYTVSMPLNDSQKYDLIVEKDGIMQRVAIRSTRATMEYNIPILHLRTTGGNQSFNYAKIFDKNSCELLFAYAPEHGIWLIPTCRLTATSGLSLGKKCAEFKINLDKNLL